MKVSDWCLVYLPLCFRSNLTENDNLARWKSCTLDKSGQARLALREPQEAFCRTSFFSYFCFLNIKTKTLKNQAALVHHSRKITLPVCKMGFIHPAEILTDRIQKTKATLFIVSHKRSNRCRQIDFSLNIQMLLCNRCMFFCIHSWSQACLFCLMQSCKHISNMIQTVCSYQMALRRHSKVYQSWFVLVVWNSLQVICEETKLGLGGSISTLFSKPFSS